MSLNYHEQTKRKGSYFTTSFLASLLTTALEEAKQLGPYTLLFVRIHLGDELCQLLEQLRDTFQLMENYPPSRREGACQRALFYEVSDLEMLKQILAGNLDSLDLDEKTDVNGQLLDLDF